MYYDGYFARNSTNIKKLWVGVNQIINNKSKASANNPTCIEIDVDGNICTVVDPVIIANLFNSHYKSVADKILKKRKYPGKKSFHAYLKNPNSKTFMIRPTTLQEIEDIISKFDTSKSTGPNGISN